LIVLSGSGASVSKTRPSSSFVPSAISYSMGGAAVCTKAFSFYAFDENRNPLPAKTALATVAPPTALGTVTFSPASVQDSTAAGGTVHTLQISKTATTDATTGLETCTTVGTAGVPLTISFTTPGAVTTSTTFTITD
jgi:hypothetical protein